MHARFILLPLLLFLAAAKSVAESDVQKWLHVTGLTNNAQVIKELASKPDAGSSELRLIEQAHSSFGVPRNGSILTAHIFLHLREATTGQGHITQASAPKIPVQPDPEQWGNVLLNMIGLPERDILNSRRSAQRYADWLSYKNELPLAAIIDHLLQKGDFAEPHTWLAEYLANGMSLQDLMNYTNQGADARVLPLMIQQIARRDFAAALAFVQGTPKTTPSYAKLFSALSWANPKETSKAFPKLSRDQQVNTALPLARALSTSGILDSWEWLAAISDSDIRNQCIDVVCMDAQAKGGNLELSRILGRLPGSAERNAWIGQFLEHNASEMTADEIDAWSKFLNE